VAGVLVRFFEFGGDSVNQVVPNIEWILRQGVPLGSTLANDKGEFAVPYSPRGSSLFRKTTTVVGFVVYGPDTGTSWEVLSWSKMTRRVLGTGEAFLIGVDEHWLAGQRSDKIADQIARFAAAEEERKAALKGPVPKDAKVRLEKLSWKTPPARTVEQSRGVYVDEDELKLLDIQMLNGKLIQTEYAKRLGGKVEKPGVRVRGPVKEVHEAAPSNRKQLGLAAENHLSAINGILDRLAPEARQLAARRHKHAGVEE